MIKVNSIPVEVKKFPDGTPKINLDIDRIVAYEDECDGVSYVGVDWFYESDDELFILMLVKKHLESHMIGVSYYLNMPYIPNARMDRVVNDDEVFTLKYFCDFINWLNFDIVYTLDAHSNVSTALLNNCKNESPKSYIDKVIADNFLEDISLNNFVLFFPDEGCVKRLSKLFPMYNWISSQKRRGWKTGNILGLDVITNGIDLTEKTILMVDDIISYGGTFNWSAERLKELGAGKIYAFATHTENSILDKEKGTLLKALESGIVEKVFTTNSIFTKEHDKIKVYELD